MKNNLIKILSAFLAVVLVISIATINSGAYLNDITEKEKDYTKQPEFRSEDLRVKYDEDGLLIVNYYPVSGSRAEEYTFPAEINGIPVAEVNCPWGVEKLTIPDGVKRVKNLDSSDLKEISFGNDVEYIESFNAEKCTGLTEIIFPESLKELELNGYSIIQFPSSLKKIKFSGEYQTLKLRYSEDAVIEFSEGTEVIFGGRPSYDMWFLLNKSGYKLAERGGEFVCVKDEDKQEKTCGDFKYYLDENGCAVISGYTGSEENLLNIPAELDGYTVVKIGDGAFDNRAELPSRPLDEVSAKEDGFSFKEVSLPSTVTEIGDCAFAYCESLEKINLSESVETIGYSAFESCKSLTDVTFPKSLKVICDAAFYSCSFDAVSLPYGTEYVGSYSFTNPLPSDESEKLKKIELADTIKFIGNEAFAWSGVTEVTMPQSLEYLGSAFSNCRRLKTVTLNDGLKEIGAAFLDTSIEKLRIPSSVVKIGSEMCWGCNLLREVSFAEIGKLKYIGDRAFRSTRIKNIEIPDTVEYIGKEAFYYCYSLSSVILPSGLKNLGASCFYNTRKLDMIVLPEGLASIGEKCFQYTSIEEITLPKNLKYISGHTFVGCKNLADVTLNSKSCEAGYGVWLLQDVLENGKNVKLSVRSVTVGEDVEYLGQYLLSDIIAEKITIEQNVKSIHAKCFEDAEINEIYFNSNDCRFVDCEEWEGGIERDPNKFQGTNSPFSYMTVYYFTLGDKIDRIPSWFFCNAKSIIEVKIEGEVKSIGDGAFYHLKKLAEITIPSSVVSIGKYSFLECFRLHTVNMSENVSLISDYAFWHCADLTEFNWNSETKTIGKNAFQWCSNLKNFDFENSVFTQGSFSGVAAEKLRFGLDEKTENVDIPDESFMACENLDTVAIGDSVQSINSRAFADCKNLETAAIADSVTEIADDAFEGCEKLTIYCNEDSYAKNYAEEKGIKVSTLIVDTIPNQTYTSKKIEPELKVSTTSQVLGKRDYKADYYNNINVGSANVIVKGTGDFSMLMTKADFRIIARNISDAEVKNIPSQVLGESPCTPTVTVKYNGKTLEEGKDYTLTYKDNSKAGTASVTVQGKGNFKGKMTVQFEIKEGDTKLEVFFKKVIKFFVAIFNRIIKIFS
ncbi:MAG TPA: hypothetical protein DCY15_08705 [Ruminococcaceae bacterium]|nr:hypothetical protein [Oscillospiraceae bacterium]